MRKMWLVLLLGCIGFIACATPPYPYDPAYDYSSDDGFAQTTGEDVTIDDGSCDCLMEGDGPESKLSDHYQYCDDITGERYGSPDRTPESMTKFILTPTKNGCQVTMGGVVIPYNIKVQANNLPILAKDLTSGIWLFINTDTEGNITIQENAGTDPNPKTTTLFW